MKHRGGCRPDRRQQLLLKTLLTEPGNRESYWLEWESRVDLEQLDPGSLRLLPLLYQRLHEAGIPDSRILRYRGIYRHYWYRNRILIHRLASALELLNQADIVPLLLKGLPLALQTYADAALRPMMDLDILVPPEKLHETTSILAQNGWQTDRIQELVPDRTWLAAVKAIHLISPEGIAIDLHGTMLSEIADPGYDLRVLKDSHLVEIRQGKARVPRPTDLLFHTIVHGHRWNALPPFRWMVDVMELLNNQGSDVAWDDIFRDAGTYNLSVRLRHALGELLHLLPESGQHGIPGSVSKCGDRAPLWEQAEHWLKTRNGLVAARTGYVLFDTWRFIKKVPSGQRWSGLRRFFKLRWNVSRSRELPAEMIRRVRKRMGRSRNTASP